MQTYSFRLFGGYKVHLDQTEMTIDYGGEKWWFITRSKPRSKTIAYEDILYVDYKESGKMAFGYVRIITKENVEYASSSYVAQHDANSFMVEKDEVVKLNEVLDYLKKKCKDCNFNRLKV